MAGVSIRIPMSAAQMAPGHVQTLAAVAAIRPLLPMENLAVLMVLAVRKAAIPAVISLGVRLGIGHGLIEILKRTQLLITIP